MHPFVHNSLSGQVAFVTGAGSGIGKATALLLSHAGARIGAVDTHQANVEVTSKLIREQGGDALPLTADVSVAAQIQTAIETVHQHWGRLDIVVANAGINGLWAPIEDIEEADWQHTLDVNLRGAFLTIKLAVPLMKAHGAGSIVVVSSVNGTRMFSTAGASAYATSKAGQLAFARMMALELAPSGIRVNTVCPGSTRTGIGASTRRKGAVPSQPAVIFPNGTVPLTPGQIGAPEQVADAIWFFCSPLASHITGAELFVDGGESLLRG